MFDFTNVFVEVHCFEILKLLAINKIIEEYCRLSERHVGM